MINASLLKPILLLKISRGADGPFGELPFALRIWGGFHEFIVFMVYGPFVLFSRKKVFSGLISIAIWYYLFVAAWGICTRILPPTPTPESSSSAEASPLPASTSAPTTHSHKTGHKRKSTHGKN